MRSHAVFLRGINGRHQYQGDGPKGGPLIQAVPTCMTRLARGNVVDQRSQTGRGQEHM